MLKKRAACGRCNPDEKDRTFRSWGLQTCCTSDFQVRWCGEKSGVQHTILQNTTPRRRVSGPRWKLCAQPIRMRRHRHVISPSLACPEGERETSTNSCEENGWRRTGSEGVNNHHNHHNPWRQSSPTWHPTGSCRKTLFYLDRKNQVILFCCVYL